MLSKHLCHLSVTSVCGEYHSYDLSAFFAVNGKMRSLLHAIIEMSEERAVSVAVARLGSHVFFLGEINLFISKQCHSRHHLNRLVLGLYRKLNGKIARASVGSKEIKARFSLKRASLFLFVVD